MNKKGEAFITKSMIGMSLFSLCVVFFSVLLASLSTDYGRTVESAYQDNFNSISTDLTAVEQEAQQIQKSSGLDAASTDIAQAQGVLSASEKAADAQTIFMEAISTIRDIVPFNDFVFYTILSIMGIAFFGAIVYIFIGRWI